MSRHTLPLACIVAAILCVSLTVSSGAPLENKIEALASKSRHDKVDEVIPLLVGGPEEVVLGGYNIVRGVDTVLEGVGEGALNVLVGAENIIDGTAKGASKVVGGALTIGDGAVVGVLTVAGGVLDIANGVAKTATGDLV